MTVDIPVRGHRTTGFGLLLQNGGGRSIIRTCKSPGMEAGAFVLGCSCCYEPGRWCNHPCFANVIIVRWLHKSTPNAVQERARRSTNRDAETGRNDPTAPTGPCRRGQARHRQSQSPVVPGEAGRGTPTSKVQRVIAGQEWLRPTFQPIPTGDRQRGGRDERVRVQWSIKQRSK